MANIIDEGVGRTARESWNNGRPIPYVEHQVNGFHIGMVMDDADDQAMGRLWIYIPGFSAPRSDTQSLPSSRTAPQKTQRSARNGWIVCYPMMPFFGSDGFREQPDGGRVPRQGDTNSYGMWYQPRIGDFVGVLFANGNPSRGYWIGCVPKQYENFMVPGNAAARTTVKDEQGNNLDGPAHERDAYKNEPRRPSSIFFSSLMEAGLLADPIRGAGTSSARRESPSRVTGIKTPGDPKNAMMGHQLVMDDSEQSQLIRMRTSKGSQLVMSDTGEFIYINTARGNVWVEFTEAGNVHVFSENSMSLHSRRDINIIADRNLNIDVGGSLNMLVRKNSKVELQGSADLAVGTGASKGDLRIESKRNIHVLADDQFRVRSKGDLDLSAAEEYRVQAGGDMAVTVSGTYTEQASAIFMNSGPGDPALMPDPAQVATLYQVPGPPEEQPPIDGGEVLDYAAPIVPQHEPWGFHSLATFGLQGKVTEDTATVKNLRRGAITPNATRPINIIGKPKANMPPANYRGNPYTTNSKAEEPQYTNVGPAQGMGPASSKTLSEEGLNQIKQFEGKRLCRYRDANGFSIGYGHFIQPGESIGDCISEDQATALLMADTERFQRCVRNSVTADVTQAQFDSLVSLAYNVGCGAFQNSRGLARLNEGNTADAVREFQGFNRSEGRVLPALVRRRQQEFRVFGT